MTRRGRASGRPGPRRAAGFTLAELLVALAVTAVAMALAAGLLDDARRLLAANGRSTAGEGSAATFAMLRRDVQAAADAGASGGATSWSSGRLDLPTPDGRVVRYELDRDTLVRRILDPAAAGRSVSLGRGGRIALRGVSSWRWRRPAPRTVEIEVVYRRPRPGPAGSRGPDLVVRHGVWVARGGGLGWGW